MLMENGIHIPSDFLPGLPGDLIDGPISNSSTPTPVANEAILFPFAVWSPISVSKIHFAISTTGGNMDLGIYDKNGNRAVSTGSFAVPGVGAASSSVSVLLTPQLSPYLIAVAFDSVTPRMRPYSLSATQVLFRSLLFTSSFPLPSSLVLGSPTSRGTFRYFLTMENANGPAF